MNKATKLILGSLFACLNLSNLSYATEPTTCPTPQAIRAQGFDSILKEDEMGLGWIGIKSSANYRTNTKWAFMMVIGKVNEFRNAQQALNKARKLLTTLTLLDGPIKENDKYTCNYDYARDGKAEPMRDLRTPPFNLLKR